MVEDYVIIREDDRHAFADPEKAKEEAEALCTHLRRPVSVYKLVGIAEPRMIRPVQYKQVKARR
jgi:hypothetical protein